MNFRTKIGNIFNPSHRATNVKFNGGFGIGLSIVAEILRLYATEIKVASTLNKGACFELHFVS